MRIHVLAVLAYVAATFAVQATSHFVVATEHYASIPFLRKDPIVPLGFLSMLIQGSVFSYLFSRMPKSERIYRDAMRFALLAGAVIASYIAFAEPAKVQAPSLAGWMLVELAAGLVQFSVYGALLGLVYSKARVGHGEPVSA